MITVQYNGHKPHIMAISAWNASVAMYCNCKVHTRFWRLCVKKNVKYLVNLTLMLKWLSQALSKIFKNVQTFLSVLDKIKHSWPLNNVGVRSTSSLAVKNPCTTFYPSKLKITYNLLLNRSLTGQHIFGIFLICWILTKSKWEKNW